ncbi:MAG: PhnD/SsuA/transferrin family substrate-binding protein [Pirellulales bacterium]
MSDASDSTRDSSFSSPTSARAPAAVGGMVRPLLYCALAAAVAGMAYVTYRAVREQAAMRAGQDRLVAQLGLIQPAHKRLAPGYRDGDGQLLADPPTDPAQCLDPETIVLAHYEGDDDDVQRIDWEAFQAHLAKATGKKVEAQEYFNSSDDTAAVKAGKIHVVALHAADTPYLVNNAGFIPIAVVGTEAGASGNHLVIAVRPLSPIKSLAQLRGHKLTCTRPDSITGYRAAVAVLAREAGMRPNVDYHVHFSHGQRRSIEGLVSGQFEVAALSADKIQSMLQDGSLKKSEIRVVYESQVTPRLTIGHIYNLKPELAAAIQTAILEFDNASSPPDATTGQPMRFFAIDYKRDFAFARNIDDSFDPRFGKISHVTP